MVWKPKPDLNWTLNCMATSAGFGSNFFIPERHMASLICGSLAFDTIMDFEGRFAEQILPDQLHILNVSFLVPAPAA